MLTWANSGRTRQEERGSGSHGSPAYGASCLGPKARLLRCTLVHLPQSRPSLSLSLSLAIHNRCSLFPLHCEMRLWRCIQCAALVLFPAALASQAPLHSTPTTLSTTLVDALNNDSDYTSLTRLLMLARLIPTLNKLNGSTLFAPTNDAIKRRTDRNSFWRAAMYDDVFASQDNVKEKLRQELFYHLLNYSLPALPSEEQPDVQKTLHFPRQPSGPPSRNPPPSPPWMPIPGGTLGGEPQRLRIAARDGGIWAGVNAFGDGGAQLVKEGVETGNGIVYGIDDVFTVPPDLGPCLPGYFHQQHR